MAKILECTSVNPASGCKYTARGETEEEVLQQVAVHAKEHGIHEVTAELLDKVKANIHEG